MNEHPKSRIHRALVEKQARRSFGVKKLMFSPFGPRSTRAQCWINSSLWVEIWSQGAQWVIFHHLPSVARILVTDNSYVTQTLISLPVTTTDEVGLWNGTLYDVLDTNYLGKDTTVAATGFNITCGGLPHPNTTWRETNNTWEFAFPPPFATVRLPVRPPGMIGVVLDSYSDVQFSNSVMMYTTGIQILDSGLETVPWVNINPPMIVPGVKEVVTTLQFFQCSQTLVTQTATVQPQSGRAVRVEPDIGKRNSPRMWTAYGGPTPQDSNGTMIEMVHHINRAAGRGSEHFLLQWGQWLRHTPSVMVKTNGSDQFTFSVPDMFLLYNLNLWPKDIGHSTPLFTLDEFNDTLIASGLENPVYLLKGSAEINRYVVQSRLHSGSSRSSSVGLLHMLWLFRNHRGLDSILPPVEDPTDDNLRAAGMVPVKLMDT
ncbi:hypothetical protein C8R44DRAFT_744107 [Mycena epipterygia]|nr:hypothetical protein C8R44DRAFT_744107 [Mycena epipterygia]